MITSWEDMIKAIQRNYDAADRMPEVKIINEDNYHESIGDCLKYEAMLTLEVLQDAINNNASFNVRNATKLMRTIAYRMACYGFDIIQANNKSWRQQLEAITLLQGRLYNSFSMNNIMITCKLLSEYDKIIPGDYDLWNFDNNQTSGIISLMGPLFDFKYLDVSYDSNITTRKQDMKHNQASDYYLLLYDLLKTDNEYMRNEDILQYFRYIVHMYDNNGGYYRTLTNYVKFDRMLNESASYDESMETVGIIMNETMKCLHKMNGNQMYCFRDCIINNDFNDNEWFSVGMMLAHEVFFGIIRSIIENSDAQISCNRYEDNTALLKLRVSMIEHLCEMISEGYPLEFMRENMIMDDYDTMSVDNLLETNKTIIWK